MNTTTEQINAALRAANVYHYRSESSYPLPDAQRNLSGRTHYADTDTLKYFKAKILAAGNTPDGLLYWLVESVASRPDHGGKNKRVVVFDLWGAIINDRADLLDAAQWHRTTAAAEKALETFLAGFDATAHTTAKLKANAAKATEQAKAVLAALGAAK